MPLEIKRDHPIAPRESRDDAPERVTGCAKTVQHDEGFAASRLLSIEADRRMAWCVYGDEAGTDNSGGGRFTERVGLQRVRCLRCSRERYGDNNRSAPPDHRCDQSPPTHAHATNPHTVTAAPPKRPERPDGEATERARDEMDAGAGANLVVESLPKR